MNDFSLLVKPSGADCNLACEYCFYRPAGKLHATAHPRMAKSTLRRMLETYLALPLAHPAVAFQGGEPLLAGEEFFREAAAIAARLGRQVDFSVQTNGTLITPSLAEFFAAEGWLAGVSVDGPAALHDRFRRDFVGAGSHAAVRRGLDRLREAGADYNLLTLVTIANADAPEAVYRHLRDDLGGNFLQFVECTDPAPHAVSAEAWGEFLCRIYDVWRADRDERRVSVRLFDTLILKLLGGPANACPFAEDCRAYFVVEADGSIFPCDFHVQPEWRLGDVFHDDWRALVASPRYAEFGRRKAQVPSACGECPHYALCRGDCVRNRGADGRSRLCAGWRRFFDHALPGLESLAMEEIQTFQAPNMI